MADVEGAVLDEDLFDTWRDALAELGPPAAPVGLRRHFLIAYLEHLVHAREYRGTHVATLLALQYVATVADAAARGGSGALAARLHASEPPPPEPHYDAEAAVAAEVEDEAEAGHSRYSPEPPATGDVDSDKRPPAPPAAASRLAESGAEFVVTHYRRRLLDLLTLEPPCPCDPSVVLHALPACGGLHEERVALLRALGQHAAAISVLVRDLGDLDAAEKYCREAAATLGSSATAGLAPYLIRGSGGVAAAASSQGIHAQLVCAALEPAPEGAPPSPETVARVMRFVSENLASADPVSAARLLPAATPLSAFAGLIERAVQHTHNTRRTLAVSRQLALLQWQGARGRLLTRQTAGKNNPCVIDRLTVCAVCSRKLAPTGPDAFIRQPDGTIQHLACDRAGEEYD